MIHSALLERPIRDASRHVPPQTLGRFQPQTSRISRDFPTWRTYGRVDSHHIHIHGEVARAKAKRQKVSRRRRAVKPFMFLHLWEVKFCRGIIYCNTVYDCDLLAPKLRWSLISLASKHPTMLSWDSILLFAFCVNDNVAGSSKMGCQRREAK
jgi:hypothetical protein